MKFHNLLFLVSLALFAACVNEPIVPDYTITFEDFSTEIAENPTAGQSLGRIQASSEVNLTFSIVAQSPEGAVAIDAATGELSVADESKFDFETNPSLTGAVSVENSEESATARFTITLTDVEEVGGSDSTVWRGTKITFTKTDESDPNLEANQDRITDNVWITRGNNGGQIFNIKSETDATPNTSPADTEWALGTLDEIESLTFQPFRETVGKPKSVEGKDLVLHLITDDIYIGVKFLSWSEGKKGGFSYERTTE
jgi:hypothetical protein